MNERWMKTYLLALGSACGDQEIGDAQHAVKWAAVVADTSEAFLAKREEQAQVAATTLQEPLSAKMKEEAIHRIRLAVPRDYARSPSDLITDLADAIGAELDLARLLP